MRKEIIPFFILIILTSSVLAASVAYPHGFNGNIIIENGVSPNGELLIGYVNGVEAGRAVIQNGKFDIVVTDNLGAGGKVEFFIGGEIATETFTFHTFEVTETNLTFETISQEQNHCNNGICESGECSVCVIGDCNMSSTICINNGVCDSIIGESCSNSPTDCGCSSGYTCTAGVCLSSNPGSPGGGDNNDNSNSGSGSGTQNLLSNNEDNEEDTFPLTTQELDEEDEKVENEKGNSFTGFWKSTGDAINNVFESGNGIYAIIGGITLVVLGIAIFSSRKKKPVENKTESEVSEDGKQ